MGTVGIIAEYNPFHTGHARHIGLVRRRLGPCRVVAVMSGNWVQRGECAAADKFLRAAWAVRGGADLVLELPTPWAAASAEAFARGAAAHLAATGVVDVLSFGSECGSGPRLARLAACLDSGAYGEALRPLLGEGLSFPACRQRAAAALLGEEEAALLARPNDNLAVEYLRAAAALGWSPQVLPIRREGAGHDDPLPRGGYASATALRDLLRRGQGDRAAPYLPTPWPQGLAPASMAWAERAVLARLRAMEEGDWAPLPDSGAAEGLPRRLVRSGRQAGSLEEFCRLAATRRYPLARLRRLVLWAFLGLTAQDRPPSPQYLRVLAFNGAGRALLREMKARASLPLLTRSAQARALPPAGRALFEAECRASDRYSLCFPAVEPCGREWRGSPAALL